MVRNTAEFMGIPEELFYWIPAEMVVVVRLPRIPTDDLQEVLVEQIRLQLNAFLAHYNITLEAYGMAGRWSTSPAMPPVRRRSFLFGLHRKQPLIAVFFHTRYLDNRSNDPLPIALSHIQSHLEELAQAGLQVVSAMPNWIVTAAAAPPLFYAHGGSAAPARPAPGLDVPSPGNALLGWHVKLLDKSIPLDAKGGEDVLVVVLDTAHHPDRIRSAATRLEHRRNWLLQRLSTDLRNEDGLFTIEYDRYPLSNDVRTGRDHMNEARYYLMPDHGLSVAGLVRDIAPRAKIRLVRILNDYGGSDLYTFFAALTDLEREIVSSSLRKVIINLSLTIMPDIRRLPSIWFDKRQWPSTQLAGVMRVLTHIEDGLRLLCEALYARGVLIVAAAGNDSLDVVRQGLRPRPPRAPARYETTLSVASVNSRFNPSMFANAANVPPIDSGVATFGGDSYGATDTNALPDAVRGIYISPTFPTGEQNISGWADLTGSSFATPIISALAAHLMGQGWSASNIITRLSGQDRRSEALFGASPDAPTLLTNIIKVQQRFGM